MTDYSLSSHKKRSYADDTTYLPTAQKHRIRQSVDLSEYTPQKNIFASPIKGNNLDSAKKSIDQCIKLVSAKKKLNQDAINEVRLVNQDLLNNLERNIQPYHEIQSLHYPSQINRSNYNYKQEQNYLPSTNYQPGSSSHYQPSKNNNYNKNKTTSQQRYPQVERDVAVTDFNLNWKPSFHEQQLKRSVKSNLSQKPLDTNKQNLQLRARLNDQIKKNNQILKYTVKLQSQLNSVHSSTVGGNNQNYINQILQENNRLKRQLSERQHQYPTDIIQELNRLKQENNQLRKDTVRLLRAKQY